MGIILGRWAWLTRPGSMRGELITRQKALRARATRICRFAVAFALAFGGLAVFKATPAAAACNVQLQLFAGAWNGAQYLVSFGTRASATRSPLVDNDACPVGTYYYVVTAHASLASATNIEYGYMIQRTGASTFQLRIFRQAVINGVLQDGSVGTSNFNAFTNPTCNTLNGANIRLMVELSSGTTWYGGYNCANSDSSMSFSKNIDMGPAGSGGFALTEVERFAAASAAQPIFSNLKMWTLSNTLVGWPGLRAWGDTDPSYYISWFAPMNWFPMNGGNPSGYACTQPWGPAPCV